MESSISELESSAEAIAATAATPEADAGLEALSQEIRRVGREVFKTNRASEQMQELFTTALDEIRQLAAVVAQVPAQSEEAAFQPKATLAREMLEVADSLEASVGAAGEALKRLQEQTLPAESGFLGRFSREAELRAALGETVSVMRQWHAGQQLLRERLTQALAAGGVRPMEAVGKLFDPAMHRGVGAAERAGLPAGTICAEERKGYLLDGRVLRYAEVVVVRDG